MRARTVLGVTWFLILGGVAVAEEHLVSAADGVRWVYGGRRSAVTGPEAKPGIDGPWRVHIKVKNGDFVLFTGSTVVFENGGDERDKVWEASDFLSGPKGKLGPLVDPAQKVFYTSPDKALLTAPPQLGVSEAMFLIQVKNLTAAAPILFASGSVTHIDKQGGNKHFMFGALVLDTESK